jgi:hypothetical protein
MLLTKVKIEILISDNDANNNYYTVHNIDKNMFKNANKTLFFNNTHFLGNLALTKAGRNLLEEYKVKQIVLERCLKID